MKLLRVLGFSVLTLVYAGINLPVHAQMTQIVSALRDLASFSAGHATNLISREAGRETAKKVSATEQPVKGIIVLDVKHASNGAIRLLFQQYIDALRDRQQEGTLCFDAGNGFLSVWELLLFLGEAVKSLPLEKFLESIPEYSTRILLHFLMGWAVSHIARTTGDNIAHKILPSAFYTFPLGKIVGTTIGVPLGYAFKTQVWDRFFAPQEDPNLYVHLYKSGDKIPFAFDGLKKIIPAMVKYPAFGALLMPAILYFLYQSQKTESSQEPAPVAALA